MLCSKTVWGHRTGLVPVCSPGAVVLFKVGRPQPHALLAGEDLQGMGIDGSGTLQSTVGNALKWTKRWVTLEHRPTILKYLQVQAIENYPLRFLHYVHMGILVHSRSNEM